MATLDSRHSPSFDRAAPVIHQGGRFTTGLGPGLYGGLMMAFTLGVLALARAEPVFRPFWVVASMFIGPRAMEGGVGPTIFGLVIHFAMSGILGMIFTRIFGRTTMRRMLAFGFFYGIVLWLIAQAVLIPLLNPAIAARLGTIWPFFLGHLAYGLALASAVPTVRDIDAPDHAFIDPAHREVRP
jgi:hypothetical protein